MAMWGLGDIILMNIAPKPWIYFRKEVWYASSFSGPGNLMGIHKNEDHETGANSVVVECYDLVCGRTIFINIDEYCP
jgi:hypothetical protein